MKIYLAGSISGCSYEEVTEKIKSKKERLEKAGYEIFSPMTGKNYLRTELVFRAEGYKNPPSTNHAIFERDKWMVNMVDIVLADLSGAKIASLGTAMELAWASLLGKYTVLVMEEDNIHRHAFILEAADIVFPTLEEAMLYLEKLAKGDF